VTADLDQQVLVVPDAAGGVVVVEAPPKLHAVGEKLSVGVSCARCDPSGLLPPAPHAFTVTAVDGHLDQGIGPRTYP